MKLSDILSRASSQVAPNRPVRFKVVGYNDNLDRIAVDASAKFSFVDERERQAALRDAERELVAEFKDDPIPPVRRSDAETYHTLFRALKNVDDPRQSFADSAIDLQKALVLPVAQEVWREYKRFEADEFPAIIDEQDFADLVEEAKKKSLGDLLSSSASDVLIRAWPTLVKKFGKHSQTQT